MNRAPALGLCVGMMACQTTTVSSTQCEVEEAVVVGTWVPVWQGFGVRWRDISHRVAFVRAGLGLVDGDAAVGKRLGILGGAWSDGTLWRDFADIDLAWTWIHDPSLVAYQGATAIRVRKRRDADGVVTQQEQRSLAELGLPPRDHWAVVLRGGCLNTDLPLDPGTATPPKPSATYDTRLGWTVAGLGAGVTQPVVASDTVTFDVTSRYDPATVASDIRPAMVASLPFAQVDTVVSWTLLGWNDGDWTHTDVQGTAHVASEREVDTPVQPQIHAYTLTGTPGGLVSVPALTSWSLRMNDHEPAEDRGRYLRAWEARLTPWQHTPTLGTVEGDLVGYVSHSSLIQEGDMRYTFDAGVGLLQLEGQGATALPEAATFQNFDVLGTWDDDHVVAAE